MDLSRCRRYARRSRARTPFSPARKPCIVAEEHLALTVDLPTDRREPGDGVPRGLPLLLGADVLAQEARRSGQRNKALPWHLLLGPAAPETATVGRIEGLSLLKPPRQRIEVLKLSEIIDLLLEERLLGRARSEGRDRPQRGSVPSRRGKWSRRLGGPVPRRQPLARRSSAIDRGA